MKIEMLNLLIYFKNIFKAKTSVLYFKPKRSCICKIYIHKNLNKQEKINNSKVFLFEGDVKLLFYRFIKEHGLYYSWRCITLKHELSDNYMFNKYNINESLFYYHLKYNREAWSHYQTLWINILKTIYAI